MPQSETEPFVKEALKDPLIHFMVLGGLLFASVSLWGGGPGLQNQIVITKAGQQHLADLFALTWQRKPTANELRNLVEEHIKEEVYYREALALGLDDNDTIVRRRLRQKLEFMQEDLSSLDAPTEDELRTYFDNHKDQYKIDHIMSFKQVLVSPKKLDADTVAKLAIGSKLAAGASPQSLSRSSLLPVSMNLETTKSIRNTFGSEFLAQITGGDLQQWGGPVYSGFGTHLVNISLNQNPKPLTFEQSKNIVAVDYIQSQREQAAANYYKNLRSQYRIAIEKTE